MSGWKIFPRASQCPEGEVLKNLGPDGCWNRATDTGGCGSPPTVNPNLGKHQCGSSPNVANPIHAATGNKFQREIDIGAGSGTPLHFARYYNSQAGTPIGNKWAHTYASRITLLYPDGDADRVVMRRPDGSQHYHYLKDGSYQTRTDAGKLERLTAGTWRYQTGAGEVEEYDDSGKLISRTTRDQERVALTYDPSGRLEWVEDGFGKTLVFGYGPDDRLSQITGPDSASFSYTYDANGNLYAIIPPDLTPADDTDNPRRVYLYEDSRFPSHLTGIVDERGNRVATWTYDDQGRAIASEHAGGVDNHTLVYNADGTTTVTDPQGRARTYSFTNQSGVIKLASITGGDCAHCGSDAASYTYDANGFIDSKTDFNGNRTTYTRDTRGRELSRTEAVGTPDERTITTTWHTEFNKPEFVTESGRLTTYTYDTAGRLFISNVQPQP